MKLTRSTDKKIFSLVHFDPEDTEGKYFKLRAWYSKLKKFTINP